MKNKNKGFTLIELLVVVAIIGILASVGVVAYNGYTASAKKGVAKSNHANVVKYIAAEVQKCNTGSDDAMGGNLDCSTFNAASSEDKADAVVTAAITALDDFKNPHNPSGTGVAYLPNILKELFGDTYMGGGGHAGAVSFRTHTMDKKEFLTQIEKIFDYLNLKIKVCRTIQRKPCSKIGLLCSDFFLL